MKSTDSLKALNPTAFSYGNVFPSPRGDLFQLVPEKICHPVIFVSTHTLSIVC